MGTKKIGMHVALLRGINVSGRNKVAMADLRAAFEEAGCSDVRTYIQNGNVVFGTSALVAKGVARTIERELNERLRVRSPVITRSAGELPL